MFDQHKNIWLYYKISYWKNLPLFHFYIFQKSQLLLKYFLNKKSSFRLSDFAKHLEKPFILQSNHMA